MGECLPYQFAGIQAGQVIRRIEKELTDEGGVGEAEVDVQSAELSMEPKSTVDVGEGDAPALLRLMDALEEHDDVDSVHANFDVPEEILEKVAAA